MKHFRLFLALVVSLFSMGSQAQDGSAVGEGQFFLYNVADQAFLKGGNNWGTRASVDPRAVMYCTLSENDPQYGGYLVKTGNNGSIDVFLGCDGYVDKASTDGNNYTGWLFEPVDGMTNTYTMQAGRDSRYIVSDGNNNTCSMTSTAPTDSKGYWKLFTREQLLAQLDLTQASESNPIDMTFLVTSPDFLRQVDGEVRNPGALSNRVINGWTVTTSGNNFSMSVPNDGGSGQVNSGCEFWNNTFDIHQTISVPNGKYIVAFDGFDTSGSGVIYGNDVETLFTTTNAQTAALGEALTNIYNGVYQANRTDIITVASGSLTIGAKRNVTNGTWCVLDNCRLYCVGGGVDLTDLINAYEAALAAAQDIDQTAAMSSEALSALQTALNDYASVDENNADALSEATAALTDATNAATSSIAAYANVPAYLAKMGGVLETTNVYTQDSYNTWYGNIKTQYEARTLSDIDAVNYTENSAFSTGWHSANYIDDILLSTWTVGGEQCKDYDKALYINTWSTEGNTDGSDFHAPFFEYWVSQENVLAANTFVCTLTGLEEETVYTFSLRARVRQTDGDDSKIPNGVTMTVGTNTVDISAGAQFQNGPFYIGNFSAAGQTDANGTLTVTITVAENSYISWLSFNNCKCTEGEDLSTYIADYQFALGQITTALNDDIYGETAESYFGDVLDEYGIPEEDLNTASKDELITSTIAFNAIIGAYAAFVAPLRGNSIDGWDKGSDEVNNEDNDRKYRFHVNTWSREGETDGSYMVTPFIEFWMNRGGTLINNTMSHIVTGLEPGAYYKVSGLVRTINEAGTVSEDGSADPMGTFIFAGDAIARAYNGTACTNGVYANPVVYGQADAEGNLTIGIKVIKTNCNWVSWKNITIVKESDEITAAIAAALVAEARQFTNNTDAQDIEDAATDALTDDVTDANYTAAGQAIEAAYRDYLDVSYDALNAAIAAAQDKLDACTPLGFMPDEYAPYNLAALMTALATAQAFDQTQENKQAAIDAATTALTTATAVEIAANTTEVNAVYWKTDYTEADKAEDNYVHPIGWTNTGYNTRIMSAASGCTDSGITDKTAVFSKYNTTYGEVEGYTMPLKADTYYRISFNYCGWGNNPTTNIELSCGETVIEVGSFKPETNDGQSNSEHWYPYEAVFKVETAGDYVLALNKVDQGQQQIAWSDLEIFSYELKDITLKFASSGATTWVTTFPVDFTAFEDVQAYIVEADGINIDKKKIDLTEIFNAAPGTPVVLKGAAGENFTLTETLESAAEWTEENKLQGGPEFVAANSPITSSLYGVVWAYSGGNFKRCSVDMVLNSAKAYLVLDEALPKEGEINFRAVFGDDDDPIVDAINGIEDTTTAPKAIYNLQGQKVSTPVKGGIYIINGKKTLVK